MAVIGLRAQRQGGGDTGAPHIVIIMIMVIMVTQHIPTMTKSHHGEELSVMMKVGMCQCQKPTIHHDELYFGVYMYIR